MNPEEFFLKAGSAGALLLLLHLRLNRMEVRLDNIADHMNIPREMQKRRRSVLLIATFFALTMLTGCAVVDNRATTVEADGSQRLTVTKIYTFWDASNAIDKLRISNGKTQSLGASGLNEASASTNTLALAQSLVQLLILAK